MTRDPAAVCENLRDQVEEALETALSPGPCVPPRLLEALRHGILVGGKRLRPLLCLASAEACGDAPEQAMPAAVAIELLHGYTLAHDDLPCMDNDLMRRGQPTVHARFGETLAVLAGDALQTLAFGILARGYRRFPARAARLVDTLAASAGAEGVVGGQVMDIEGGDVDEDRVLYVHRHKTADLFQAALCMGGLAAGAPKRATTALAACGHHLGMAFQIVDDLQDAGNPDKALELNCLMVWTPEKARARVEEHTAAAVDALRHLPGPTDLLAYLASEMGRRKS